jgi:hypothetical protein
VQYLDDLIGSLQCPSCGEEILQGRAAPEHREDQPTPGVPLLAPFEEEPEDPDAPQKVQEKRPERHREPERRSRYADEPNLHDPMTQPRGVRGAGITWYACGIIGLALNAARLLIAVAAFVYIWILVASVPPFVLLLPALVLLGLAVLFYAPLIWIGVSLRGGSWRYLQVPAGFVLLSGIFLFLWNAIYVAVVVSLLAGPDAPVGVFPIVVMVADLACLVPLLVVDLLLIRSSQILLWQATKHAHWFNAGNVKPKPAPLEKRTSYPATVGLAGFLWLLVGFCGIGINLWLAGQYVLANAPDPTPTRATILLSLGVGVLFALLTTFYLGVLLLGSRLPSTLPAGIAFLVLSLFALVIQAYSFASLDLLPAYGVKLPTPLLNWLRFLLVIQVGLTGVAFLASVACIIGDGAYRSWLRTWRGWRV